MIFLRPYLQIVFLEMKGFGEFCFGLFLFMVWVSMILNSLLKRDTCTISLRRI